MVSCAGHFCPLHFNNGDFCWTGPKACKDPRITPLTQLLGISNRSPEIQLPSGRAICLVKHCSDVPCSVCPSGWLMLHQYIYIVQPNTDENGWQYRSSWSDGIITSRDEQWVESPYHDTNHDLRVRRRCLACSSVMNSINNIVQIYSGCG